MAKLIIYSIHVYSLNTIPTIYLSLYNKLAYIDTSLIINKNKKNAKLPVLTKLIIRQHRIIPTRVRIKKNALQIPTLK